MGLVGQATDPYQSSVNVLFKGLWESAPWKLARINLQSNTEKNPNSILIAFPSIFILLKLSQDFEKDLSFRILSSVFA